MGGNIWKDTHNTIRLNTADYLSYKKEVVQLLKSIVPNIVCEDPRVIKEKDSFGDMDLLVKGFENKHNIEQALIKKGYLTNSNGNVFSFLYNNFQIDLIFCKDDEFEYSYYYFSYNDMGNLIGRLAKNLGFKHGHNGLFYVLRHGDHLITTQVLSKDYTDILKLLLLDVDKFLTGFDTYIEMFEYIMSSPYFNRQTFLLENLNHINKVRDRKRKTYNMFLTYLEEQGSTRLLTKFPKLSQRNRDLFVSKAFPEHYKNIQKIYENFLVQKRISNIMSIDLYQHLVPFFKNKVLGDFIKFLKTDLNTSWLFTEKVLQQNKDDFTVIDKTIIDAGVKFIKTLNQQLLLDKQIFNEVLGNISFNEIWYSSQLFAFVYEKYLYLVNHQVILPENNYLIDFNFLSDNHLKSIIQNEN